MQTISMILLSMIMATTALGQQPVRELPKKIDIPHGAESFCAGFRNVFRITKQEFSQEANILCQDFKPTPRLLELVANPYEGGDRPVVTIQSGTCDRVPTLCVDASGMMIQDPNYSGIIATYSMRIPLSPVDTLLGEEEHVAKPYVNRPIQEISSKWIDPPANLNDADTAFAVEQHTVVSGAVNFDDRSVHDLKLYRLYQLNADFFMAVRTLRQMTPQFKHSVVLRGVMRDPNRASSTISLTVQHMIMKNHGRHPNVVENYTIFLQRDMQALFDEQTKTTP